jgi:uncharacterized DUF497 family protein
MHWTWDENKNRANKRKHGLDFGSAMQVFEDRFAIAQLDRSSFEERWQTIGLVRSAIVVVSHTLPAEGSPDELAVGRIISARGATPKGEHMKKANSKKLTSAQIADLDALAKMPDSEIDFSDIPEIKDFTGFKRGLFYRPVKKQMTLRLDADILEWFKRSAAKGAGYQTAINAALRQHVAKAAKVSAKSSRR